MNYNTLKDRLADPHYIQQNSFKLLQGISLLVNSKSDLDKGRDLVIRALAHKNLFTHDKEILYSLVRSVGLFPYYKEYLQQASFEDLLAYEFHRAANLNEDIVFHSLQSRIYQEIINGRNIVLSANTSVGKSLIIDAVIASNLFYNIVLVVPTIALIDETRQRLSRRFRESCKIITHQSQERKLELNVTNVYILTQERVLERTDLKDIDLFVIDEFYKLDPKKEFDDRTISLNLALYKLLQDSKQFYLIGPNIDDLSGLENFHESYTFIHSSFSTVAVDVVRFNFTKNGGKREIKLIELCKTIEGPTLIYCQSPNSVNTVAELLLDNTTSASVEGLEEAIAWISAEYHVDWLFIKALKAGIGLHHGGIPRALQQYCIQLYNKKLIRTIICTSTIIEGVNTVTRNVIIYDRRKNNKLLDYFTYKNIEGRGGRMGEYFIGCVYSLEPAPEKEISTVKIPLGEQGADTPVGLLLHLNDRDLKEESLLRIENELSGSILSRETIMKNLPYTPQQQNALAKAISTDLVYYDDILYWTHFPNKTQLKGVCNLIFDYLEESSLKRNYIFTGDSLYYHIQSISMARGYRNYLKERLIYEAPNKNPNDIIEESLKIIRNVVCFSFPRALRALQNIQEEVLKRNEIQNIGDYILFGSEIENLFLDPALFALDEYGIPLQTASKLAQHLNPQGKLDPVLEKLKVLNLEEVDISSFEKTLLTTVKENL